MKRFISLLMGPLLFALCYFFLPESLFATAASRGAVGTVAWMAAWWIFAPVDYAVTAFLPIIINALLPMASMKSVIANYSSETILLLLGASILTVSWEETGLDNRIAAKCLSFIGNNFRKQLIFFFLLSTAMSAVLPNAIVCATLTPIAVALLKFSGHDDVSKSSVAAKLLLTIAYGVSIGGLATPLGGAMNLVTVDYIQKVTGKEFFYVDWVVKFLPAVIVLVISNIIFLIRDVSKTIVLNSTQEFFDEQMKKQKMLTREEIWSFALFVIAATLAFTRQFYQHILPGFKPAYAFITCAVASFLITRRNGIRLMKWGSVQTKIIWSMIYIFAGGLALGTLLNESQATSAIGKMLVNMNLNGSILSVFIIVTMTLLLSDVTSNTATAAVCMPIVVSMCAGQNLDPIPFIFIASIGVNISYMLPTSIRAIPVGYGLSPQYMFKEGYKLTIIVIILMSMLSWYLLNYTAWFKL